MPYTPEDSDVDPARQEQPEHYITRAAIWSLLYGRSPGSDAAKSVAIHNYIWDREQSAGGMWICATDPEGAYLLIARTNRLVSISPREGAFVAWLHWKYGLNPVDKMTKHVIASLQNMTMMIGHLRPLKRFAYYNEAQNILYLSRYDGTCWRINGEKVDVVPNGTGCLFIDDDNGRPETQYVSVAPHGILFPSLVDNLNYVPHTDGGMSADQQRLALTTWIFAIAFPELMETKPMLLIEGAPGSGKTTTVMMIKYALHGYSRPMTVRQDASGEADFFIQLLTSPIALLDNVDNFVKWLQDAVCGYVTGAEIRKRKLYTDAGTVVIRPQSFIAVASKNPLTFRRDDVADRCILIRLERRQDNANMRQLFGEIENRRPEILGEWLYYLNKIVAIRKRGTQGARHAHRMADFAHMAELVGEALGRSPHEVEEMLGGLQAERETFSTENDVLVDLLDAWVDNTKNTTRHVTAGELHIELVALAKVRSREYRGTPASLAQQLTRNFAVAKHFVIKPGAPRGTTKTYKISRS